MFGEEPNPRPPRLGTEISNLGIVLSVVVSKSRLLVEPRVRTNEGKSESRQVCPKVLTKDCKLTIITKGSDKMKSPLVVNVRCTCIEEYLNIQKLHKEYIRQSREGQITSVYVGAEFAVPGEFEAVDALIAKRGPRQIPCVDFGNRPVVSERITGAQGNGDGTVTETVERVVVPQAVDGGIDAMGNPPLPESNPATEPTHFAEEPVKAKPEITLTDVLTAMAEEPDLMEAIKTEAEGEPDGDGQDYNTTYAG